MTLRIHKLDPAALTRAALDLQGAAALAEELGKEVERQAEEKMRRFETTIDLNKLPEPATRDQIENLISILAARFEHFDPGPKAFNTIMAAELSDRQAWGAFQLLWTWPAIRMITIHDFIGMGRSVPRYG